MKLKALLSSAGFGSAEQGGQIVIDQFADALNSDVRWRIGGDGFRVECVMPLAREDGR